MTESLSSLTRPFEVVQQEPLGVRAKFLEGQPYITKDFPGPFEGLTQHEQAIAAHQQRSAVKNWHNIAEEPLQTQASMYPTFNAGLANCESYGGSVPLVPRMGNRISQGPPEAEGVLQSWGPLQVNNYQYQVGQGSGDPRFLSGIECEGRFSQARNVGAPQLNIKESFGDIAVMGLDDFNDESITNPCNQTGFGEIVPKFVELPGGVEAWSPNSSAGIQKCSSEGNPLIDIENRPVEQFSHNNMVPFYGSKLTQSMASTGVPQAGDNNSCNGLVNGFADVTPYRDKLQTFTGCDEMYMHKRETSPMFSPSEQATGWVFGTPAFRPDLERYKESIWRRNNEAPIEKQQVGPGIGLDFSVPAQGGFQQYTRVLPNNVNNYKANQLEGRVNGGKWNLAEHPTSQYIHGVSKNNPDVYMTQARRPTMKTKFYNNAPEAGDARLTDYNLSVQRGRQARPDTEQGGGFGQFNLTEYIYDGSGNLKPKRENFTQEKQLPCIDFSAAPIGKIMKSHVPMPTQDLQSYSNIRETFKKGAAGYNEKTGFWECNDSTQGSNRWGLIMGPAQGAVPNQESRQGKYVNFTDRGDVNPFVINVTGTTQAGGVWSPNSFHDQQKVTRKETTEFSHAGNPTGSTMKATIDSWSDKPKVTRKETTDFSHSGNAKGVQANLMDRGMYTGSDFFPLSVK